MPNYHNHANGSRAKGKLVERPLRRGLSAKKPAREHGLWKGEWERVSEMEVSYFPSTQEKIKGATMVASLSTMNLGVFEPNLPQVIFSLGTAPE